MRLGVTMFATDTAMPVADLARSAEERGFVSLYLPEHTHIPVSRRTPPPAARRRSRRSTVARSTRWWPSPTPPP
nr:hypothetical protein GCM10020093_101410 [Planobispora longispora]